MSHERQRALTLDLHRALVTLERETKALHPVGFEFHFFNVLPQPPPHSICSYFLTLDVVLHLLIASIFLIYEFFLELTALCLMFVSVSSRLVSNYCSFYHPPFHFTWNRRPFFLFQLGFFRWVPFDTLETIYWCFGLCVWGYPLHRSSRRYHLRWCKYLFLLFWILLNL